MFFDPFAPESPTKSWDLSLVTVEALDGKRENPQHDLTEEAAQKALGQRWFCKRHPKGKPMWQAYAEVYVKPFGFEKQSGQK